MQKKVNKKNLQKLMYKLRFDDKCTLKFMTNKRNHTSSFGIGFDTLPALARGKKKLYFANI